MSGVKVMRVLMYEYPDVETAAHDMKGWTNSIHVKGHGSSRSIVRMTSATFPFEAIEWDEKVGADTRVRTTDGD